MFKYSKFYSGKDPELMEGDIFKTIVPLDDGYREEGTTQSTTRSTQSTTQFTQSIAWSSGMGTEKVIIEIIEQEPYLSQKQIAEKLCLNQNTLKYYMKKMREQGIIERVGTSRKGKWIVK